MILSDSEEDLEIHPIMAHEEYSSARFILLVPPATPPKGPGQTHTLFDLRQLSIRNIVGILRGKKYPQAMVLCKDIEGLKRKSLLICLIMGVRSKKRTLIDENGKEINVSIATFIGSIGKLAFEALISLLVLIFSYISLLILKLSITNLLRPLPRIKGEGE